MNFFKQIFRRAIALIRSLFFTDNILEKTQQIIAGNLARIVGAIAGNRNPEDENDPPGPLTSCLVTQSRCEGPKYRTWCERLREPVRYQRKQWERIFIAQVLFERGLLIDGNRGIGFGVGTEPLPALFASLGCEIVATDQANEMAAKSGWTPDEFGPTGDTSAMNKEGICDQNTFVSKVSFQTVDMRSIPPELNGFDFCWSSCALEHLGSLAAGFRFIEASVGCLKPGGVAVHTTEYNLSSNEKTIDSGPTVIYRRRDIDSLADRLSAKGIKLEQVDWDQGDKLLDGFIDLPPYHSECHLRLLLGDFICTSIGLIFIRNGNS